MTTSRHRKEAHSLNLDGTTTSDGAAIGSVQEQGTGASPMSEETTHGKIEVSPKTISHIASRATQQSYGVVGLTSRHARPGWAELLRREEEYKGVVVKFSGGRVIIDLYVVIEYGTRISEVARNIMSSVKFAVESALGLPVVQVNVNVQNIRISE
jgi:uncharacterized alkaline shock family protein YloU